MVLHTLEPISEHSSSGKSGYTRGRFPLQAKAIDCFSRIEGHADFHSKNKSLFESVRGGGGDIEWS